MSQDEIKVKRIKDTLNPVAFRVQGEYLTLVINLKQLKCLNEEENSQNEPEAEKNAEVQNDTSPSQEAE